MTELTECLLRWALHRGMIAIHQFKLNEATQAYNIVVEGHCGKVVIVTFL